MTYQEDKLECTRCETSVDESATMKLGDAIICEICWDDF